MPRVDRLSAMPLFLRHQEFWARILDPNTQLANKKFLELRISAGCHRWDIQYADEIAYTPSNIHLGLIDIAQSILERGVWTAPSWKVEQQLADLFANDLGWELKPFDPGRGALGYEVVKSSVDDAFRQALVTARWQVEAQDASIENLWDSQTSFDEGSSAERQFLDRVLVPTLGYPLLDYVRLQVTLTSLGLDPIEFGGQRADFVIAAFRNNVKLIIEVDGGQHAEAAQSLLDKKRDEALKKRDWIVWRVQTCEFSNFDKLQNKLKEYLHHADGDPCWGVKQLINKPREHKLMNCVWGATSCSRIQFILLEALRIGILPWDEPWHIHVIEHDTRVAQLAVDDLTDWFGRLRNLYGLGDFPGIKLMPIEQGDTDIDLIIDLGIINPYLPVPETTIPIAWSRPANEVAPIPQRLFTTRMVVLEGPSESLITTFVQDLFRKTSMRDGQNDIIGRILRNQDVIGLLPTGGGKSLTYHLCGLLRGGMTVYVSPLKSLLQDQHDRLVDCGIDLVVEISSALTLRQRESASQQLITGGARFLLISPERFLINQFRVDLAQFRAQWGEVSQVVIDECHCVSEWGHDFRPSYLSLGRIVKDRTKRLDTSAPLVALTGTASSIVLADVRRELGVIEDGAVIRARKLDRPEIDMKCIKLSQKQKHVRIQELVKEFVINSTHPQEGLLIFCRFIGSTEGVLNITSELLGSVPRNNLRFYCGSKPDWQKFAAFITGAGARQINQQTAMNVVPSWALDKHGQLAEWERVKNSVQRDFISGLKASFPVLVATTAFGMGIDKPSVRQVIHIMTPQSPEAYYQEVGRAGRDKVPSKAILLFSDEDAGVTDSILAPGVSIDEARSLYQRFKGNNRYGGGDFIRTFFFHQSAFPGPNNEARYISTLLKSIRQNLAASSSLVFQYHPSTGDGDGDNQNGWADEKNLEYAVVRLIILGVVRDYTKDYNGKTLEIALDPDWEKIRDDAPALAGYYADNFRRYVQKYQVNIKAKGEQRIRMATTTEDIENETATAIVVYAYEQIERKRREASRQMLELARKAVNDPEGFRQALLLYLQVSEKYTQDLEALAKTDDIQSWKALLDQVGTPDEIAELHGACQRVIESFPTHAGLRAISAVTRRNPSADEIRRSLEEFDAAMKFCKETQGAVKAKAMGDAMLDYTERTDIGLTEAIQRSFGRWLMGNGFQDEALQRFFIKEPVRNAWLSEILRNVNDNIPMIKGL